MMIRRPMRYALMTFVVIALWSAKGTAANSTIFPNGSQLLQPDAVGSAPPSFMVSFPTTNQIGFVDPTTELFTQFLNVGFPPGEIVVHPRRPFAYVIGPNGVAVFDLVHREYMTTFAVPSGFSHLLMGKDGDTLYGLANGAITAISTKTGAVVLTISFGSPMTSFTQSSLTHDIFASVPSQDEVVVFDSKTGAIEHTIVAPICRDQKPCHPDQLVSSTDGLYVAGVARKKNNGVVIFDAKKFRRVANVYGGETLIGVETATDQAWYTGSRRGTGFLDVVNLYPPFSEATTPMPDRNYGPFYGHVAFDTAGTIGLVIYTFTISQGLMGIVGPRVTIPTQTTPSWIAYAP